MWLWCCLQIATLIRASSWRPAIPSCLGRAPTSEPRSPSRRPPSWIPKSVTEKRDLALRQLSISWSLLEYHFKGLSTEECLWQPTDRGFHVIETPGGWVADWPETEGYSNGPPSIAWLMWHIGFWWSMVIDHSFGGATLRREDVTWPGTADRAVKWIEGLHHEWVSRLEGLSEADFSSAERSRWPISDRPFVEIALWLNLELMKNAGEVGYCRFLYGVRE